jgi:hypothetical protein
MADLVMAPRRTHAAAPSSSKKAAKKSEVKAKPASLSKGSMQRFGQVLSALPSTAGNTATNAALAPGSWSAPLKPVGGGDSGFPSFASTQQKSGCDAGCATSHHVRRQNIEEPQLLAAPAPVTAAGVKEWQKQGQAAKEAEESAEKARYFDVGTKIAPYRDTLATLEEMEDLAKRPDFYQPLDTWYEPEGRKLSYTTGQDINGYRLISPQYGVVERNGYFYKIGTANLNLLANSTHVTDNPTIKENLYLNTRGAMLGWALMVKGMSWAAKNFGGPLGAAAGPVLDTATDQAFYDDEVAMAHLQGQTVTGERPDITWDTAIDSVSGAVGSYAAGKVSNFTGGLLDKSKALQNAAPWVQRGARVLPTVAGTAAAKEIGQGGEVAKAAIHGKGISASDFVPSAGVGDIEGMVESALTGWFHKGWTHGKAPKGGADTSPPRSGVPARKAPAKTSSQRPPQQPPPHHETAAHADAGKLPPQKPGGDGGGHGGGSGGGGTGGGGHDGGHGGKKSPEPDPEIEKAFASWDKFDQQSLEEARAKAPNVARGRWIKGPIPELVAQSMAQRKQRADERAREQEAKDPDPAKAKEAAQEAKQKAKQKAKYQKAVRDATKADAQAEAARHDAAVHGQPAMTHEDMYKKTIAQRGFEAGARVMERGTLQKEYDAIQSQLKAHPDAPEIAKLHEENKTLRNDIAKLERKEKAASPQEGKDSGDNKPKLTDSDRARLKDLETSLAANKEKIDASPVTALSKRANIIHDKLAISGLNDPASPNAPSPGARAGRGENTYVVIQVLDQDGTILASATGKNSATRHAEENAIAELNRQIARRGKLPAGTHIEVVGDQVICTDTCKPALRKFAAQHSADRVDGYTFHAVEPGKEKSASGDNLRSAKTTAQDATTAAAARKPQEKHEPVYERGVTPEGDGGGGPGHDHPPAKKPSKRSASTKPKKTAPQNDGAPAAKKASSKAAPKPKPAAKTPAKISAEPATQSGSAAPKAETPKPAAPKKVPPENETAPKAAKTKAKAATPENTQPVVREPGNRPSEDHLTHPEHPPSSKGQRAATALGKADAALGAVRDYNQYRADGKSEGEALTRSGTTLAANLQGGPAAAIVNAANAYDNARHAGQGKVEAMATAIGTGGGGLIADKVAPTGPVGIAVNLGNTAAQALGAPQGVQDATSGAAALVPSNIVGTTITEGARSYANLGTAMVTGDTKALDKQVQGMQAGNAGPWLQGYAQMTGMAADLAAGDSFDKALDKAAASGKGSWADRVGSKGGDGLYELGQSKEAKSGKYGASVQGVSMSLGIASDMIAGKSFEQALDKAGEAGRGSWAEQAGSALGDAAWDATEKTKQLIGQDLPAAKQLIKDKWKKLWA